MVSLQFLGCGDAFGSGGRFQTCFHVDAPDAKLLIDCGASSLVAMRRFGVDPNALDLIVISHLHGDHFGGLPFIILHAQFNGRSKPLRIAGPPGLKARLVAAQEALFPNSSKIALKYPLEILELTPNTPAQIESVAVTPHLVSHPCGAPPFAPRVSVGGKTLCYSGDTEWTEALIPAAEGADLFICESSAYDRKVPHHIDFVTLWPQVPRIGSKRFILTHMGPEMLSRLDQLPCDYAEDGKVISL